MENNFAQEDLSRFKLVEKGRETYATKLALVVDLLKSEKFTWKQECFTFLAHRFNSFSYVTPEKMTKDIAALLDKSKLMLTAAQSVLLQGFIDELMGPMHRKMLASAVDGGQLLSFFKVLLTAKWTEDRIHLLFEQLPKTLTEAECEKYADLTWKAFYQIPATTVSDKQVTAHALLVKI